MWEWIVSWFSTQGFPPRWRCGEWPEWLGWLHITADTATFVAYTTIPVVLASILLRRRDLPFPRIFALFAAFIFACGAVHAVEAMLFWQPMYYLSGLLKGVMAVVSVTTVLALVPTMRRVLSLPGFQRDTARLATIVAASEDSIISKNVDGIVESWNAAAERMYGYTAAEMVGQSIVRIVPPERHEELHEITARVRRGEAVGLIETVRMTKDGTQLAVSLTVSPVRSQKGDVIALSSISRDITEQRRQERALRAAKSRLERANRRLKEQADHDPLTGLWNRRGMEAALAGELERMQRNGSHGAVVMIDCDDFKGINEHYGHQIGDEVLREVANRIDEVARDTDHVARIGGDEFLVLAVDTRVGEAVHLAERIRSAIAQAPVATSVGAIDARVSCGVEAIDPGHGRLEDLVGESSAALRNAKVIGKNSVSLGAASPVELVPPRPEQLRAVAQPIVDLADGRTIGHEMLVRGPSGPLEAPLALLRAHRSPQALASTDLACLTRCLQEASSMGGDGDLHVNLLPSTLLSVPVGELVLLLRRIVRPARLCLEINEGMVVGDPALLAPRARELRRVTGVRLAIDNVGFGRGSLETLIVLEPDVVKIARQCIHGVSSDPGALRRLARLVQVGHALGAKIIAEGVERPSDRAVLRQSGIRFAQGFLFGRPAPRRIDSA